MHHNPNRFLHIDVHASKQYGFGNYNVPREKRKRNIFLTNVEPIFLNRCLTNAEIKYWPTEFKTTGLVWVVKKFKHMLNATRHRFQIIIYIDHSATTFVVKQIKLTTNNSNKFNFRLIRASIYVSQFEFDVKHRPGKLHVIPDVLSRL